MAVAQAQSPATASSSALNNAILATLSATTAGNLIVVAISVIGAVSGDTLSITDTGSNSYLSADTNGTADTGLIQIFYAKNAASATTITGTISSSHTGKMTICAIEYSGASKTTPLLTHNHNQGTGTAVDAVLSVTGSNSTVSIGIMEALAVTTVTEAGGFSADLAANTTTGNTIDVEEKIGTGSFDPTWTLGLSNNWKAVGAAFQADAFTLKTIPYVINQAVKRAAHY